MKEKISDKRLGEIWDELEESILHADCNVGEMREQQKIVIELLTARQTIRRLNNAWMIDETIQTDGSLKPSISDTIERYENIIKWLVDDANRLADVVRRIKNCTGTGTEGFYSFCGKDSDKLDAEDILFLERLFVDAEFSLENNEALLNNLRRINETSK